jgi:multidrug efflux pump
MLDKIKEFKPASWSIDNKTTIFILTFFLGLAGILYYQKLPKEQFPDIVVPTIYVTTVYAGSSPSDMENLVAKPLEKQMKALNGVKKVTSNSIQDFCSVIVEFNTDVKTEVAKQRVKDAIDKASRDLPQNLTSGPTATEINFSDIPIMAVNVAGDYDLARLKKFADAMKDRFEALKQITRIDMIGALNREISVDVDMYKMQSAQLTIGDISRAVQYENMNISGGSITTDGIRRTLVLRKEFRSVDELRNIVVGSQSGALVYLRDVADVTDGFAEQESYARLDGKNVITLNVIKRSGENLIVASDEIHKITEEMVESGELPKDLKITFTGEQADNTRVTLHDLINTIIIGFLLVVIVLMFFMGATNSFFVALSVPLSMAVAFIVLFWIGYTMNMIVLFSFLLALGIVVDDAIVVIENTHRIFLQNPGIGIVRAAKLAAGEVFMPVLSGTLTTLAPFIPLAFWSGIIGKFMVFLPVTLIITLLASLVVAYIINPVFAVQFMKHYDSETAKNNKWPKWLKQFTIIAIAIALLGYASLSFGVANFAVVMLGLILLHHYVLRRWIFGFQERLWPRVREWYGRRLTWAVDRPAIILISTFILLLLSVGLIIVRKPAVEFFPTADPNFIYTYVDLPIGADQAKTDSVTKIVEARINKLVADDKDIVKSIITNVTIGATDPSSQDNSPHPEKGKVTVAFVPFAERDGKSSGALLAKVQKDLETFHIAGAEISAQQEQGGPPVGKAISIEISGDYLPDLTRTADDLKHYLDSLNIEGVSQLKSDVVSSKPEIIFSIDRERANREGLSSGQLGMEIRNSVLGSEASKYRDETDEYKIMVRYKPEQRKDIGTIRNLKMTYRDMNMGGMIRNIPLSSFAKIEYGSSYGMIKRKGQKRVITLESDVLKGFDPNSVVAAVQVKLNEYTRIPSRVEVKMGGQQEEQQETASFLGSALLASIGLIILILVTQFNSFGKPLIILSVILFSVVGVLLGVGIFGDNISILMTGVGIVALAGIVVRNGILIVEFIDILRERGMNAREAVIEAGKTRMTPVVLTATATILGLIPLAIGLNIDFATLFSELNPHIFLGGDSVAFWGPLSWTMIYGLAFATILTLIVLPALYMLGYNVKYYFVKKNPVSETNHSSEQAS